VRSSRSTVLYTAPSAVQPIETILAKRNLLASYGGSEMSVWMILFIVLLLGWIGGFVMFHVAGGLIHLLLLFAVISIVLHFVMGKRTA
jgi:uncharacterized protein DUF5670